MNLERRFEMKEVMVSKGNENKCLLYKIIIRGINLYGYKLK